MIGCALYALAHLYQLMSTDPIIKHTKKCKYCKQRINEKVSKPLRPKIVRSTHLLQSLRCINCTSWLDGREERIRY